MSPNLERESVVEQEPERDFRILVVEDDPGISLLLSVYLRKQRGWSVDTASDGDEGLEMIRNSEPSYDVVVTGWTMPGRSGVAMTKEARKDFPQTDFILMSRDSGPEIKNEKWLKMKGFKRGVAKPFDPLEMVESIKLLLQDRKRLMPTQGS